MARTNGDLAVAATAVIAFVALVRPDIGRTYSRWLSTVDVHLADRIEVGLSNFGPTIGLQGTMRAINGDQFISSAKVIVERVTDNMRHEFEWAVFRPQALSFTQPIQTFEIAAGFSLRALADRHFNIQFHDRATADRLQPGLLNLQRIWGEYLQARNIVLENVQPSEVQAHYTQFHQAKLSEISPIYQIIDREFYWREGSYKLALEMRTSRPARTFRTAYTFNLSSSESDALHLNEIACFHSICGVPNVNFNFAYPQHQIAPQAS